MNGAFAVTSATVLLTLVTVAVAEQELHVPIGVTDNATVVVAPDCRVGIRQTTALLLGPLQVPEPALALLSVTPWETAPLTEMPVATSGPSLATVKVIVTALPALTIPAGLRSGATQVRHKSFAGPSFTTNASLDPLSVLCSGLTTVRLVEVVSPAK